MKQFENAYGYDEEIGLGKWFTVNGIKTKLAYMGHPKVEAKAKERREQLQKEKGRPLTEDELINDVGNSVFIENVLVDWEVDGMDCTLENKEIILKKYPKYIDDCVAIASNNKKFQEEAIEERVGKS